MTNQSKPRTMKGRKFYIVWNEAKNEGFATDDEQDAISCYRRVKRALSSTVGDAFAETYEDDELFLEVLDLPAQPAQPMREALEEVKRTLEQGQPAVACTVWCATKPAETLLDHVTAALVANGSAE